MRSRLHPDVEELIAQRFHPTARVSDAAIVRRIVSRSAGWFAAGNLMW